MSKPCEWYVVLPTVEYDEMNSAVQSMFGACNRFFVLFFLNFFVLKFLIFFKIKKIKLNLKNLNF